MQGSRERRREKALDMYKSGFDVERILIDTGMPRCTFRRILIREKLESKNLKHMPRRITQFDTDGNKVAEFKSISEASKITGLCRESIRRSVNGFRKTFKGYEFYETK